MRLPGKRYIIGIDEVGRGALAGPVTVAAIALSSNSRLKRHSDGLLLKDSKQLTARQREKWFGCVREKKLSFSVASVSSLVIDKINISKAANLAARRALLRLIDKLIKRGVWKISYFNIRLDGGLFLSGDLSGSSNFK